MASAERTEKAPMIAEEALANAVADEAASSAFAATSRSPAATPSTRSSGRSATRSSPARTSPVFEQKGVEFPKFWSQTATNIVAQKYFRGRMTSPERETTVKQMIGRIVDTIGRVGPRGRLLRRRGGGADLRGRAQGDPRQPARRLQLAGLVQRRLRGEAAVLRVLHPLDRGLDGGHPRLDPPRGRHLPRRLGLGRQPLAAALLQGAALEGRLRLRAGLVHARRRRVRRHDQVGRQDAARGEDGRARRRPPRRRGVHLVQGARGGEGARPRAGGLRHVARLGRLGLDPVPEREQLGARHRRVHGGGRGRRRVEPDRAHRRHRRRHRPGARRCCTRWPRPRGSAPTRACSTTRRSTRGTRCRTPAGSTRRTRARSTCRSTTRRATSPRST